MTTPLHRKSTIAEIEDRFDRDVERFSQLDTGQQSTLDAPLVLNLLRQLAPHWLHEGSSVLDLGCGAGNYTLTLLEAISHLDCTLLDVSHAMLARAKVRIETVNRGPVAIVQGDMREAVLPTERFDLIVTGAALHHLREPQDWDAMFRKIGHWLKPNGILFVSDLVTSDDPGAQQVLWDNYGRYLESLAGPLYREKVFAYIDREDSPRSLPFQFARLQQNGFKPPEVIHRNSVFATYWARRAVS